MALEAGTLRVRVPDAGWRKVLHRMRGDILARLYDVAGELAPRRLGFMEAPLGSATQDAGATGRAEPGPRAAPASPRLLRIAAEAIADPELRARFLASAALYLGRSRRRHERGRHPLRRAAAHRASSWAALKGFTAPQLGALVVREAVARAGVAAGRRWTR